MTSNGEHGEHDGHLGDTLDRAIDDVVRELTAGGPATGFNARVLARVQTPAASVWPRRIALSVAGALAMLVLALLPWRGDDRDGGIVARRQPEAGEVTASGPEPLAPRPTLDRRSGPDRAAPDRLSAAAARVPGPGDARARTSRPAAATSAATLPLADAAVSVPPLRSIAGIAPVAIDTGRLDTTTLVTAPIAVETIAIDPLSSDR